MPAGQCEEPLWPLCVIPQSRVGEGSTGDPDAGGDTGAVAVVGARRGARSRREGPNRSARVAGEEEREGIALELRGQVVEDPRDVGLGIGAALLEGVQPAHEDLAGLGPRVRLGPEAHLAGDDRGAEFPFAAVVVGGHGPIRDPVGAPVRVRPEEVLELANAEMLGGLLDRCHDLRFELYGLGKIRLVGQGLMRPGHRVRQQGTQGGGEGADLGGVGALLAEVLHLAAQGGDAVLERTGRPAVPAGAIHHPRARQGLSPRTSWGTVAARVARNKNRLRVGVENNQA